MSGNFAGSMKFNRAHNSPVEKNGREMKAHRESETRKKKRNKDTEMLRGRQRNRNKTNKVC